MIAQESSGQDSNPGSMLAQSATGINHEFDCEDSMTGRPGPGQLPTEEMLVNVPRLIAEYYAQRPDARERDQRVAFGTSGHRGSSLRLSFNELHILATTQAICDYRRAEGIDGPLYLGIDTHGLSEPAFVSAMEVLAANGVRR